MKNEKPKGDNTLLAYVWDKMLKIYKHILMKAYECKMRAFVNEPSLKKQGARLMRGKWVIL